MTKNVTISIPDELHGDMKRLSWINWSAVCRVAIKATVKGIGQQTQEDIENKLAIQLMEILR